MRRHWLIPALIALALAGGCRDRAKETAQTPAPAAPAVATPAPETPAPAGTTGVKESLTADEKPAPAPAARTTPRRRAAAKPQARATESPAPAPVPVPAPVVEPAAVAPEVEQIPETLEVAVPSGTALTLELVTPLSSETATVEMPVQARLREAVTIDNRVALPVGALFSGVVTAAERSGRVQGLATLAFAFDRAMVRGTLIPVQTQTVAFQAEPTKGEDAAKIGGGAIGGAIIGGILGGAKGAAKGAAIGGAAGTGAVLVMRGKEVELPAGTTISVTLAAPVTVTVPYR